MFGLPPVTSLRPVQFIIQRLSSRNGRVLVVIAGFSVSVLVAGLWLQCRRRRYRAVSTGDRFSRLNTFHSRQNSFQHTPNHTLSNKIGILSDLERSSSTEDLTKREGEEKEGGPLLGSAHQLNTDGTDGDMEGSLVEHSPLSEDLIKQKEGEGPLSGPTHRLDTDGTHGDMEVPLSWKDGKAGLVDDEASDSDESFHSTVDEMSMAVGVAVSKIPTHNELYFSAMELVMRGGVKCRKIRDKMLGCAGEQDFLAKVHCVRLAFDDLVQSSAHRNYFVEVGRNLMSDFLRETNQSPTHFIEQFDALVQYMGEEENREVAWEELTARKVVCMNLYDVALDFILLDAFDDLNSPPAAIVAVLENTWISAGMKTSALSAAIWSISKAKKSILRHKHGFMSQFYSLTEILTPTLAWGFLGTDQTLKEKCSVFRSSVLKFVRDIFSLTEVRYNTVASLSDDILRLAQQTAHAMDTS